MKLSVIIPAFNEEKLVAGCVGSVLAAFQANAAADWTGEVIVTDNNSTDRTAELARTAGASVVFEPVNQISRARNAGARVAGGDWFLFIDADSWLHPATLAELLRTVRRNRAAGGGCLIGLDDVPPFLGNLLILWDLLSRTMRWAAGSFVFCRADAFREVGGFSTELYAAEEIRFSQGLKRWANDNGLKVVILSKHRHISSGRKLRIYNRREWLRHSLRSLAFTRSTIRDRAKLDIFYDGRR
jgi:glycosyltransferase involved in cell wall biosynthesis